METAYTPLDIAVHAFGVPLAVRELSSVLRLFVLLDGTEGKDGLFAGGEEQEVLSET